MKNSQTQFSQKTCQTTSEKGQGGEKCREHVEKSSYYYHNYYCKNKLIKIAFNSGNSGIFVAIKYSAMSQLQGSHCKNFHTRVNLYYFMPTFFNINAKT